ncbi:MAG: RNAase, partial [Euryarchaeota archaeon]|nr:RNAase [Euryarchaeota archaeon]
MSLLNRNTFFVREHVGYFKAANAYDVLDPATGQIIGTVRETIPNLFIKLLKFTGLKTSLPFTVDIFDDDGKKLVTLKRGFTLFR